MHTTKNVKFGKKIRIKGIDFILRKGEDTRSVTVIAGDNALTVKRGENPVVEVGGRKIRLCVGQVTGTKKVDFGVKFIDAVRDDHPREQSRRRSKRRARSIRSEMSDDAFEALIANE